MRWHRLARAGEDCFIGVEGGEMEGACGVVVGGGWIVMLVFSEFCGSPKRIAANVPHSQREALYHLVRVSMGDVAFLN